MLEYLHMINKPSYVQSSVVKSCHLNAEASLDKYSKFKMRVCARSSLDVKQIDFW